MSDEKSKARVLKHERLYSGKVLDLDVDADAVQIKSRYIKLVKQLHPDANGGNPEAEERLKTVNHAYTTLKNGAA